MRTIQQNTSLRSRLRKAKAGLLAVALTLAGVLLIMFNTWLSTIDLGQWGWLRALPLGELGGTLFGAGVLGTLFEYSFRKDQEESDVERFREIIHEQAPAMRDAVLDGFAIHPEDLERVANPDLLDEIATNAMGLRLGDPEFARELYAEVRDQAIHAPERWYNVEVTIRLSSALERSAAGAPLFDVTVETEYTTSPTSPIRQFACTSDRSEFNDLRHEVPSTAVWFITARPGIDVSSRASFELLELTVDGNGRPIRRSQRKTGQSYSVDLGGDAVGRPVRIRQVHRTITPQWGHRLFIELPQPAREISLELDYTDTSIAHIGVTDTVASLKTARILRSPRAVHGRTIGVEVSGWLLPKAGFAFTWTLASELPRSERSEAA